MKVVELTRRTCLLVASGGDTVGSGHATTQDYTVNDEKEIWWPHKEVSNEKNNQFF